MASRMADLERELVRHGARFVRFTGKAHKLYELDGATVVFGGGTSDVRSERNWDANVQHLLRQHKQRMTTCPACGPTRPAPREIEAVTAPILSGAPEEGQHGKPSDAASPATSPAPALTGEGCTPAPEGDMVTPRTKRGANMQSAAAIAERRRAWTCPKCAVKIDWPPAQVMHARKCGAVAPLTQKRKASATPFRGRRAATRVPEAEPPRRAADVDIVKEVQKLVYENAALRKQVAKLQTVQEMIESIGKEERLARLTS